MATQYKLNIELVIDAHPGISLKTLADMYENAADGFAHKPRPWRNATGETGQEIAEHQRAIAVALRARAGQ